MADECVVKIVIAAEDGRAVRQAERAVIEHALASIKGRAAQAKWLGIGKRTLGMKLAEYQREAGKR